MKTTKMSDYLASRYQSKTEKCASGFVTISRQAGAGGITVGEKLADFLNKEKLALPWTVFDKDLVHRVMQEHQMSEKMLPYLKEENVPEFQDTMEDVLRLHPAKFTLVQKTSQTIRRLAETGHVIIVGRGASVLTRDVPVGVHVRLIGSLKKRKEHIKEYYKFDEQEAKDFIKNEDRGRAEYLKKYFDKNIDDMLLYDLVLNTDNVSYDDAALLIGNLMIRKIQCEEKQIGRKK